MQTPYSIIFLATIIVVLLLIFTTARRRIMVIRNWLFVMAGISSFVIFYVGYKTVAQAHEVDINFSLSALHNTIDMILLSPDTREIDEALKKPLLNWAFIITNIVALVAFVLAALAIFARRSYGWIRVVTRIKADSYIFTDCNNESITLAKDILKNNSKALVLFLGERGDDKDYSMFNKIEDFGGVYLELEGDNKNPLSKRLLRYHITVSKTHLFYISNSDSANISDSIMLVKAINEKNLRSAEQNIKLHIRSNSNDIGEAFEEYHKSNGKQIEYSIFSDADLIAYDVISRYAPVDQIAIDTNKGVAAENYEVMIVGFDTKGGNILRKMVEFGQFVSSTFKATIVDKGVEQKRGSFAALYPGLEDNYNLCFEQTFVGEKRFFEILKRECTTLKQVVVALGSDSLNIQTAIEIDKLLHQLGYGDIMILAVVAKGDDYHYIHTSKELNSIHCIGQQEMIFTEKHVVKESVSAKAREVNEYYRRSNPSKPKWEELPYIKKESNISVAMHQYTKRKLLGLSEDDISKFESRDDFRSFLNQNSERFENLARTEHLRWNATYFARGWQQWNLASIPKDNKLGQDSRRKLHCCLVEWEQLPEVDLWAGKKRGEYQSYDFDNIVNLVD